MKKLRASLERPWKKERKSSYFRVINRLFPDFGTRALHFILRVRPTNHALGCHVRGPRGAASCPQGHLISGLHRPVSWRPSFSEAIVLCGWEHIQVAGDNLCFWGTGVTPRVDEGLGTR